MNVIGKAKRLRIYIGESDKYQGKSMHTAIVEMLRREGYAGATVLRGIEGYGRGSRLHTAKILRLSEDLPLVIDIVDIPEKIEKLLPVLQSMGVNGLITIEDVEVHSYGEFRPGRDLRNIKIREIMTPNPISINVKSPIGEAIKMLYDQVFKSLPVVDSEKHLLGVITSSDLVNQGILPFYLPLLDKTDVDRRDLLNKAYEVSVSDVMSKPAVTINQDATAQEAANLMTSRRIKRLPVVDDQGKLVGMISRIDLIAAAIHIKAREETLEHPSQISRSTKVSDIMYTQVPTVDLGTPILDVVKELLESPLHRLIVVDQQNKVKGIIGSSDLIDAVSGQDRAGIMETLRAQILRDERSIEHIRKIRARTAEDIMNREVVCVSADANVHNAAELMVRQRKKILPVVDSSEKLVGVIARDEILSSLSI